MPKSQRDLSWDVVETKKPDASAKRPPPPVDDAVRAHAEWFAWAKRHKADFGRAHGAARKAVAASERGLPAAEVEKAAREAIAAGDTTPVDETRQAYSAWFAVAAVDMAMEPAKAHTFAQAGYAAQRDGADVKTATSIAEAAVAPPPPPPPPPAATAPPPPPPPPPPGAIDPGAFATVPIAPRPGTFPPQPPVDLGDWGPPPGAPSPPAGAPPPPPPPPAAPPLPVSEQTDWSPPTPFTQPPPPTPTVETPAWSTPTSPPPSAGPPQPLPPPPPPPAPAADPGAWSPPTKLSPPPPPRPAPTRQGAIDKAVADTKVVRPTRSEAKLVTYGELKKATKRTLRSDRLPEEVKVWVVAVAGTLTSLAEPVAGHAVAYLAADQRAGIGYDIHTGSGWPAWFDDLPDQATD